MAVYKNDNGIGWKIVATNPITHKKTTIRKNPKTSMNFQTKKEAKEYEQYYLRNKINLSITLDELFKLYIHDYLALRPSSSAYKIESWYKNNIKKRLGKRRISSLKLSDLERLAMEMQEEGYSINYTNKMTTNIKTVLNYAVSHGYLDRNPVAGYKGLRKYKTSAQIKYWTPREFKTVIDSVEHLYGSKENTDFEYIRFFLMFGYFTGARKGEIRALKWHDIELFQDSGIIHFDYHINSHGERIRGRKNGDGYSLHMDSRTFELVKQIKKHFSIRYDEFNPKGYVFPSFTKGFFHPLGDYSPTRWVAELSEFNDLPYITFHGLRHSLVCYLATEVKLTPYEVADRIGDTVPVVMEHYYQFFQESRKEVANAISKHDNKYFDSLVKQEK